MLNALLLLWAFVVRVMAKNGLFLSLKSTESHLFHSQVQEKQGHQEVTTTVPTALSGIIPVL